MASLPRILTVDPSGNLSQQVRAAIDLMDRLVVQIEVPSALEAIEELKRRSCQAVIAAWQAGDNMQGWQLAAEIKQINADIAIIIVADYDDMELDAETISQSPFAYMHRPLDVAKFLRVIKAAVDGEDILAILSVQPEQTGQAVDEMGPVPILADSRVRDIVDQLLRDLNAMAILLASRDGKVLVERGATGIMNRESLTTTLAPIMRTNFNLRQMVGGNSTTLQFYDGEAYDVFVLSVGFHHFLCIVFDGSKGAREFGAVNRFGRRSSEDLIALLGAEAWLIRRFEPADAKPQEEVAHKSRGRAKPAKEEVEEVIELEVAVGFADTIVKRPEGLDAAIAAAKAAQTLVAIPEDEFDLDTLFGSEFSVDDDIFDPLSLEELANANQEGKLTQEDAKRLGLIK